MSDEALRRVDALVQVGIRLARSAPTGKIVFARLARSIDPAWIPHPWGEPIVSELDAAQAVAEPIEYKRIERILRDAWGVAPSDELEELDRDPVAVTPISQVHRGTLDGVPVAVKVLRPGLAASVRNDLALLEGLSSPLSAAFPAIDPGAVLREVRERVLDELDLENEAGAQRRFHRALRNHPSLTVPSPVTRLAHENVLVTEWVDGVPLSQAPDPDRAAALLVLFGIGAARAGVIHADPNPDDVLVLADGRLAILDFGASRTVNPERVKTAAAALEAFVRDDQRALGDALARLGWLAPDHVPAAAELARHALGELDGDAPVRLDSEAVLDAGRRLVRRPETLAELVLGGALAPEDLWPARGAAQLFGTIARVGATGRWRELTLAALRDGWDATPR